MPYIDLSAFPTTQTAFGRWQPLNAPLGLGAFGINAIECDPGEAIDTTHDETDTGQHEAYIVVAGRAEFRIGLDIYERCPGPSSRLPIRPRPRSFRAARAGHAHHLHRRGSDRGCAGVRRVDRVGAPRRLAPCSSAPPAARRTRPGSACAGSAARRSRAGAAVEVRKTVTIAVQRPGRARPRSASGSIPRPCAR